MPARVSHIHHDPGPGGQATRPDLSIYANPHYADGYDVVIHNECAADEDSAAALDAVLAPHRNGTPAVNLHCAMHSYRSGSWKQPVQAGDANARWFEFTGIQSTGHGPQSPIRLTTAGGRHPVVEGFVPYTTGSDELYNNLTGFGVTPVLNGVQPESRIEADRGMDPPLRAEADAGVQHDAGTQQRRHGRSPLPRPCCTGRPVGGRAAVKMPRSWQACGPAGRGSKLRGRPLINDRCPPPARG